MKSRINFSDLKIGDLVLTSNNKIGEVIALKSYAYLNNKINKKTQVKKDNKDPESFKLDNSRHNGIWYATVTVAIEDEKTNIPQYYIENLDFVEIRKIVKDQKNKLSFINKLIEKIKICKFLL